MKCKHCLAQVSDDVDTCPNCGQVLSSLRQLLKSFYSEEAQPLEDPDRKTSQPGVASIPPSKETPKPVTDPRGTLDIQRSGYSQSSSPEDKLGTGELLDEEGQPYVVERARPGGFWLRYLAFTFDLLILVLILAIFTVVGFLGMETGFAEVRALSWLTRARLLFPVLFPLGVFLILAYFSFFQGCWGQTIGKMIFGLHVIKADGQPIGILRALARTVAYAISALPFFLGFIWIAFSFGKRGWHDSLAGTVVVRE